MADVTAAAVLAGNIGVSNTPRGVVLGYTAEYTVPASGAPGIGDKVEMIPVPKGARILSVVTSGPAGTATMTATVGDDDDPDRFTKTITASAAFTKAIDNEVGVGFKFTADDTIDLTFLVAAPTATHVYRMAVTYFMD